MSTFEEDFNRQASTILHDDSYDKLWEEYTTMSSGARKETEGKLRFDLIPPEVDKALAEVYTLGAAKYDDRNWEKGIPLSVCIASLKRHLNAFELGEMINIKDGDHLHIQHALFWCGAIVTFLKRGRDDLNDLPAYDKILKNNEK
jgi:hypothetical protein